jgi:hypothetical protein
MSLAIKKAFEALVKAAPKNFQKKLASLARIFFRSGGSEPGEIKAFAPLLPIGPLVPFPSDDKAAHRVMCSAASLLEIAQVGGPGPELPGIPKLWPSITADAQGLCRRILQAPLPKHLSHEGLRNFMAAKGYVCELIDAFGLLDGDHHIPKIGRKWSPTSKSGLLDGPLSDD